MPNAYQLYIRQVLTNAQSVRELHPKFDTVRFEEIASFDQYLPVSKATRHVQGYRFSSDCVLTFQDEAGDWGWGTCGMARSACWKGGRNRSKLG